MGLFSRITSLFSSDAGQVRAASRRDLSVAHVGSEPLSSQFQRIGGNLTPQQVSSIIIEADSGQQSRLVDLANEARQKECTLHCVLQTRELSLGALDWQVNPKKGTEGRRKSNKIAELCADALRNCDTFDRMLQDLQGAPYYGHSTSEAVWVKDGRFTVPVEFIHIQQRRFEFRQSDGRLCLSPRNGLGDYPVDLILDQAPGKFVQHQPRINGDVPAREGLSRVLMWAALFRNWGIRDWLQLGEMGWKPTRLGTYKKGADAEDIEALYQVLAKLTASGWAGLPDTTEVTIEWPKGNAVSGTHKDFAEFIGAEMAKATLGQTLTTDAGDKGARSLGDVHDRVRRDILEADARSVAQTINRFLIRPLVRMNFGANEEPPEFKFITAETANVESFGTAMSKLAPVLKLPAKWAREQIGAPEPQDDEELVGQWQQPIDIPIDPKTGMPAEPEESSNEADSNE